MENSISRWLDLRFKRLKSTMERIENEATERFLVHLESASSVFVTGRGRTGLVAQCFAMRLMQLGLNTHVVGETTCPSLSANDLLVAFSCSGHTRTTVEIAEAARGKGAEVGAITAEMGSALECSATFSVIVPPVEEGMTDVNDSDNEAFAINSVFEESVLLYCDAVVSQLMNRNEVPPSRLEQLHANLE